MVLCSPIRCAQPEACSRAALLPLAGSSVQTQILDDRTYGRWATPLVRVCGPLFLQVPRSTLTLLRGPSFTLTSWVALLPCRAFDPWHRQALCGSHSFRGLLLCGALGKPEAHPWDSENSLCLFAECSWHRLLWLADKKTTLPLADGVFPCAFYCARRLLSAEARLMLPLLVAQPACPDPAQPPQALLGFFLGSSA